MMHHAIDEAVSRHVREVTWDATCGATEYATVSATTWRTRDVVGVAMNERMARAATEDVVRLGTQRCAP